MVNMKCTHKILVALLLLFSTFYVQAQDISFVAKAPKEVAVGEQFMVVYEVNARVSDFSPPQFNDFIYLTSQKSMSTVNWNTTLQFAYRFKANQEGTFNIEPAKAKYKGDVIESNSFEITVKPNGQQSQQSSKASTSVGDNSPKTSASSDENVFVRLVLNKKSAYIGEQITGYIKVYTKIQLSDVDQQFQGPDFRGFYMQNINTPPLKSLEPEKVGGETYYSGLLRKVVLIPQKSGEIVIEPFEIIVKQEKPVKVGHFTTYQLKNVPLSTRAVTVNVKQLPANKPAAFTGAIGDLDIKASLNASDVQTNDAVTFKISVSGKGNIKLIDNINYNLPPTFDVFDPVVKTKMSESGLSGVKTFEITAIPRHAGTIEVKPFELVYFNPSSGKFVTKKTQAFTLNVAKGANDSSRVIVSNLSREEVELLQSDIRYILTDTELRKAEQYNIRAWWYYLCLGIGASIFVLLILFRREQIKRNANMSKTKHKQASKMATKRLKLARKLMGQEEEKFYEELSRALWGYVADKLSIPQSELSAEQAKLKLISFGVDEEAADQLLKLIETCEFARYAPGTLDRKPEHQLEEAGKLISRIEQNI